MAAPDQQHMAVALQQPVHGDKHRRVGRLRPGGLVAAQHAPLGLHGRVLGGAVPVAQPVCHVGGQPGIQLLPEGGGGRAGQGPVDLTPGRGIKGALARQAQQAPAWKTREVVAALIFEVAYQGDMRVGGHLALYSSLNGLYPAWFVVIVTHGYAVHACGFVSMQAAQDELCPLLPGERVFGAACLPGAAQYHHHVLCGVQRLAQQGQVPVVKGLKAANQDGGVGGGRRL